MANGIKCTCGHSWNKSDSSKKDMYVCHICGKDNSNNMKNGGWLDKFDDELPTAEIGTNVAKADATRVAVPTLKFTKAQLDKNKAINKQVMANTKKAEAKETQDRKDRISKANAMMPNAYASAENFATSTSAIADKLRFSEKPNFFDDYINPAPMFGEFASGLGQIPLNIKQGDYAEAAMNFANPVVAGAAETIIEPLASDALRPIIDPIKFEMWKLGGSYSSKFRYLGNKIKPKLDELREEYVDPILGKYVDPILYRKEMSKIKKAHADAPNYFNDPRNEDRLRKLGLNNASRLDYPELTFTREGSHYNPFQNKINIDFNQAKMLADRNELSPHGIYDHEVGHWLQRESNRNSSKFGLEKKASKEDFLKYNQDYKDWQARRDSSENPLLFNEPEPELPNNFFTFPTAKPTFADEELVKLERKSPFQLDSDTRHDSKYFGTQNIGPIDDKITEPFPHMREMRRDMIERGILSDEFQRVNPETIKNYFDLNPKNRIAGFTENNFINQLRLTNSLNRFPSAAPVIGAGAAAATGLLGGAAETQQQRNGGWLNKYEDGGEVNYNDASVSYPPNFVGDGYDTTGRNYSPAWGGQFEDGGEVQPIYVTDKKDPRLKAYKDSLDSWKSGVSYNKLLKTYSGTLTNSYDLITDPKKINKIKTDSKVKPTSGLFFNRDKYIKSLIAGKEAPHLNPEPEKAKRLGATKYGNGNYYNKDHAMLVSDMYSFKKPTQPVEYINRIRQTETPELQDLPMGLPVDISLPELQRQKGPNRITMGKPLFPGGPQTDYYTPIDEDGNVVNTPEFKTRQYAMGGSLPGATGMMYARYNSGGSMPGDADYNAPRTGKIPNNGKYAKKTKASAQDGTQIKQDNEWLTNWYQNRKIPNQQLQALYEEDKPYYVDRLNNIPEVTNVDLIGNDPNITGRYKTDTNEILMTPGARDNVYLHEANHYLNNFPSAMRTVHGNITDANIVPKENLTGVYKDKYDYFSDPDEVHSRIQVLRKKANLKPDEEVTPERLNKFLKTYEGDDENINNLLDLSDSNHLLEMLNYMAYNPKQGMPIAQNGMEMKYYQEGLDFQPKTISRNGSVIKDDRGQWAHPGEITEIGSNQITMQGVPYPVLGISDTGDTQMMYPNQEYQYDGESVTEYPMMKQGGQLTKLDQLTNFTNYNTKQSGGWLDKYND